MNSSLIPEKPVCFSPSLAATLGLEEATMLSLLDEALSHRQLEHSNGFGWCLLDSDSMHRLMPFWTDHDIGRIAKSLRDKGVILISTSPFHDCGELRFALNEQRQQTETAAPARAQHHNQTSAGANRIAPNWQPSDDVYGQLAQHNIPNQFARAQIPEFITYWRERDKPAHSWGAKFVQQVIRKWREHETDFGRREQEISIAHGWRPSRDAMEVLVTHAGINQCFVEDAIPEFVLYWEERGEASRTWNSKFIQHVRRQWARYSSTLQHDTEPRRLAENWQPSEDVYEVLSLANIDHEFARAQLGEFIIYWRDSNQLHASWNTKFLQHVKYHWAKRHAMPMTTQGQTHARTQNSAQSGRTRDRTVSEQLNDRSWAL